MKNASQSGEDDAPTPVFQAFEMLPRELPQVATQSEPKRYILPFPPVPEEILPPKRRFNWLDAASPQAHRSHRSGSSNDVLRNSCTPHAIGGRMPPVRGAFHRRSRFEPGQAITPLGLITAIQSTTSHTQRSGGILPPKRCSNSLDAEASNAHRSHRSGLSNDILRGSCPPHAIGGRMPPVRGCITLR